MVKSKFNIILKSTPQIMIERRSKQKTQMLTKKWEI